jgi:hypothetical protein
MVAPRPPVAVAPHTLVLQSGLRFLRRFPQLAARKPPHFGVGVLLANPIECRQQIVAFSSTKCRRQSAGEDRPVRITRWHVSLVYARLNRRRVASTSRPASCA